MSDTDQPKEAPAAESADDNNENVAGDEIVTPELGPACMDLTDYKPKVDHFENIQALPEVGKIEGAPNFRQVRGDMVIYFCIIVFYTVYS